MAITAHANSRATVRSRPNLRVRVGGTPWVNDFGLRRPISLEMLIRLNGHVRLRFTDCDEKIIFDGTLGAGKVHLDVGHMQEWPEGDCNIPTLAVAVRAEGRRHPEFDSSFQNVAEVAFLARSRHWDVIVKGRSREGGEPYAERLSFDVPPSRARSKSEDATGPGDPDGAPPTE